MAKRESPTKAEQSNNLADDIISVINKSFKDLPGAATFLSDANLITDWLPTGCDILDLSISNRPNGGLGYGTVVEISGLEGSGKSLLAAHALTQCQKQGGLAVLFDTEKAVGMLDFYQSIGLDPSKTIYTDKIRTLEEIYESIEKIIIKSIASDKEKPLAIVVDSVMGASTLAEIEADYEKDGYATTKAIVNSKAMRKIPSLIAGRKIILILINQLRANVSAVGFGADKWTTSGGQAIPFTASTRLRTKKVGQIKGNINGVDAAIGERIEVQVVKNRLGPPRRKVTFDIRYDSGIDNYGSWLTALKELGAIGQSGAFYSYKFVDEETGEEITKRFQSKDFKKLMEDNPELRSRIYGQICDSFIMLYKKNEQQDTSEEHELGIDDIEIEPAQTFE